MKLIKQKTLYFSEGKSDKVYEVDLCESQDLFVVNFRYGRRGANLREGTKTVFPVTYEEAEKIFNKLVESKEKKGYSENTEESGTSATQQKEAPVNTAREETILKYLQQAIDGNYTRNWRISKVIARVKTLNITSSSKLISQFIKSDDEFEQYNAISALLAFENGEYSEEIFNVFTKHQFDTIVGRVAVAYILKFGTDVHKEDVKILLLNSISEEKIHSLPITLMNAKSENAILLYQAYLFSYGNEILRDKVYEIIEKLSLKANTFKSIRYIYRASQALNDVRFFALISKRIAISKPGYTSSYLYIDDEWISVFEEKQKPNPTIAFSSKTKDYFNKETYKKVYNLSVQNPNTYIEYATELLCSLNDEEDNVREDVQYLYNYNFETRSYENEKRHFPKYHTFLALMYVLYGNSSRFQRQKTKWYYLDEKTDNSREEVLSNLWNENSAKVLQILTNTKSDIAVDFSLRILDDNPHFLETLSDELISKLVSHRNPKVLDLITDVLQKKYENSTPETSIVFALLESRNEKSVELGLEWLEKHQDTYVTNADFLAKLVLTDELKVSKYLTEKFKDKVAFEYPITIEKIQPLFEEPNRFNYEYLFSVNHLIGNTNFGKLLSETPASKIAELSNSQLVTNKLFAINLAKHNSVPAYELFKDSFDDYINSDKKELRKAGIELVAHFPDEFLLENKQKIISFCFSEHQEVREAIQPTVERLIKLDNKFKENLRNQLLVTLTNAESYEGLHQNCYELLTQYYDKSLSSISEEQIIQLILSKYEFAQKLGTPIFENRVSLSSLSMPNLVRLSHSDVLSIREKLYEYFKSNKARVNYELEQVLPIFNTDWQDVIDWSCNYFGEHIDAKNWTVDMLLYACDHVKEDVQAFGRKMVTKHFSEEKGLPLLLKLQEHPTKNMRFFVTNYLDNYAKDNEQTILSLESYFKTSLFTTNSHRATKTRIYTFLEQEAIKNKEVAKMVERIISSILDTKTITDRSKNIDVLLTIADAHPDIEIPLLINDLTNEI